MSNALKHRYDIYFTNGAKVSVYQETKLSLEQLQGLVGGYIEFADGGRFPGFTGYSLCVDEEGLLKGEPKINPAFTIRKDGVLLDGLAGTVVVGVNVETPKGREFHGIAK
jgi:hypothetical protein